MTFDSAFQEGRQPFEYEVYDFLSKLGINTLPYFVVTSIESVHEITAKLKVDMKYVLKVISPKILHKSDMNAVFLDVISEDIESVFIKCQKQFDELDFRGLLITPLVEDGVELILGSTKDDTFGTIIVFGIGGTLVEVIDDVSFAKCPLEDYEAEKLIDRIEHQEIFNGPRGLAKTNRKELIQLIVGISKIVSEYSSVINEMDLNPIRVTNDGIFTLDGRVILSR